MSFIDSKALLRDFKGNNNFVSKENQADVDEFRTGLRAIIGEGVRHGMDDAGSRALIMVNRNFGYSFDTIPFGRISEMVDFIRNNWFREVQITEPDLHTQCMLVESDYTRHFRLCDSGRFEEAKEYEKIPIKPEEPENTNDTRGWE
jgi:hypothetical protein